MGGQALFASLFGSYGLSLLPMLVVAWIDRWLSHYRWRVLVCFVAGFGMAIALLYILAKEGIKEFQQHWFFVGLVDLPAGVCSWLSGRVA